MCESRTVPLAFLKNLTDWRNEAQTIQYDLLKLIAENDSSIRQNDNHNAIAQLLVGASFSFRRAVFFTDNPLELDDALNDAKGFLEKVVSDNAIGYSDEKKFKRWTAGFYVSHIQYRLYHLQATYGSILTSEELRNFLRDGIHSPLPQVFPTKTNLCLMSLGALKS